MKKTKPTPKKVSKTRLLCVTLSESLLKSTRKYRREAGFSSMSELLRATVNYRSASLLKKNVPAPKKQISFRLSEPLYFELMQAADRSGQSIARIIRTLLENAPGLGIRPHGVSAVKKKKSAKGKKSVPAKKSAAKKKSSSPAAKKAPAKKSVPAKKKTSPRKK